MKLHKIIALTVVCMLLCGMLPTGVTAGADRHPLKNGDFENGTLEGWQAPAWVSTFSGAAYMGNYGCLLAGDGGWDDLLSQTFSVVPHYTYTLTFWYKTQSVGVSWYLFDGDKDVRLCRGWADGTHWTKVVQEFTPSTDTVRLVYRSSGSHIEERVFLDCVQVSLNPCITHAYDNACDTTCNVCDQVREVADHVYSHGCDTTCDACGYERPANGRHTYRFPCSTQCHYCDARRSTPIAHSYSSVCATHCAICREVREVTHIYDDIYDADCNHCGHIRVPTPRPMERLAGGGAAISPDVGGIAFRFFLECDDAILNPDNSYSDRSALVYPYNNNTGYRLVRIGAVMSNEKNPTLDLEHLTDRTLNIQVTYLCKVTADRITFAVRILNIPHQQRNTIIYARPYYVYSDGNTEVVVYGDVVSQTYNRLASGSV